MDDFYYEVIDVLEHPCFVLQLEEVFFDGTKTRMKSVYTKDGDYIGDEKMANKLCKLGIEPEMISKNKTICQIGFDKKSQKWFGWSHRAIAGFGIGDEVTSKTSGIKKAYKIKNLKQAKETAIKFAESVA